MTDLEKRADEYAIKVAEKNVMPKDGFAEHLIRQAYLDATKAETALLSQHILDLQKDKGNLTDRVRELEKQLIESAKAIGEGAERYVQLEKQYLELEQENEKMKNCFNCAKGDWNNRDKCIKSGCVNKNKWEIKEK